MEQDRRRWTTYPLSLLNITKLRPHQLEFVEYLERAEDFFVILPTGYGKSLCYVLAPYVKRLLTTTTTSSSFSAHEDNSVSFGHDFRSDLTSTSAAVADKPSTAIIIVPLISIAKQQVTKLRNAQISAVFASDKKSLPDVLAGEYSHIFLSPELVEHSLISELLLLTVEQKRKFTHIFVDESHCVAKWGQSDSKTKVFRKSFAYISGLRAALPSAAMVALTATAPPEITNTVMASLSMTPGCPILRVSPNKENIRYSIRKLETGCLTEAFGPLVCYTKKTPVEHCEKVLIFCRQLKHIGAIFSYLKARCPPGLVDMYHRKTPEKVQDRICKAICSESQLKIVICSSSFSMGMDIPNLHLVMHYGIPSTLDDYMQETGRIGRDGLPSYAILLHHRDSIKGSHMTVEAKTFSTTDQCLREHLMNYFKESYHPVVAPLCCSNCHANTKCCLCSYECKHVFDKMNCTCVKWCHSNISFQPVIEHISISSAEKLPIRVEMSEDDLEKCRKKMANLSKGTEFPALPGSICNEVYPKLLDNVLRRYRFIHNVNDINDCGAYSPTTSGKLLEILNEFAPTYDFSSAALTHEDSDGGITCTFSDSEN